MAVAIAKALFNAKWRCVRCGFKGKAFSRISQQEAECTAAEQEKEHWQKKHQNKNTG
jgi:hypothetical protein